MNTRTQNLYPADLSPVLSFLATLIGFRFMHRDRRGWDARMAWGSVSGGLGLSLALCLFEEGYSLHIRLGWPNVFIRLPIPRRWLREPREMMESWGFSVHRYDVHLNWGAAYKICEFPWAWAWHRTSYLRADGTWHHETRQRRKANEPGDFLRGYGERKAAAWRETHPYTYTLRSGEVQQRMATIEVSEGEHRRRCMMWLPFFARVTRGIDVSFDDEVGERSGSWKGGCIGCAYTMRPDETPEQTLRRMEAERRF